MITLVRSAQTLPGKFAEAVAFGKEIGAIVKRVTGKELAFCAAFGGAINGVAWISQFDFAAQLEDLTAKLMADREYGTALTKAAQLFVPGTGHDQMWRRL